MHQQPQDNEPKQLPVEVQKQVKELQAKGVAVEVVNLDDPTALNKLPDEVKMAMAHQAIHMYRSAAYHYHGMYKRSNLRFYVSVVCNLVLLAVIWLH